MSPHAKFGLDRLSRSAGHRQQTNKRIAFYYVDSRDSLLSCISVVNEADGTNCDKSCLALENQLKLLLSRLDVLNVVRTREYCCRLIRPLSGTSSFVK